MSYCCRKRTGIDSWCPHQIGPCQYDFVLFGGWRNRGNILILHHSPMFTFAHVEWWSVMQVGMLHRSFCLCPFNVNERGGILGRYSGSQSPHTSPQDKVLHAKFYFVCVWGGGVFWTNPHLKSLSSPLWEVPVIVEGVFWVSSYTKSLVLHEKFWSFMGRGILDKVSPEFPILGFLTFFPH